MQLKNAKILLTGGSLGIGKETARVLIQAGAKVLITGRNEQRLQQASQEIGAIPVTADIGKPEGIEKMMQAVHEQLGGLDVLINNAGIGEFASLEELRLEQFHKVYAVNVFGLAMLTQQAVKLFKQQSSGNIINIASSAGVRGFKNGSIYASSKFALRGMTECWRDELRPFNIRVMLVNPSEVTTAFGNPERKERAEETKKLRATEIAHVIKAALEMDNRGFIPEVSVWATNPF
ncbi:SDR family oxidoreductase [Rhodocytophaga aerolata]|uniref:SDR family oxidoreductase n=1 Tax=Rhodocytophaga aerolata TaxID=455078 RepID=A0ABT8R4B5_9BACT|nr:SDR family oxidoreductase [Rhodocytophaga aerolata]MDO1446941.1 SDR family oxidoreductase [Rhodocytophaga aerolata]